MRLGIQFCFISNRLVDFFIVFLYTSLFETLEVIKGIHTNTAYIYRYTHKLCYN